MNMLDIINRKKRGEALTHEEISFFIKGVTDQTIKDYQISALLMCICFKGMNKEETSYMTKCMIDSGEVMDLSEIHGIKVDKHSTGGVGDKTTLIVGPIVSSCGVPVAKMSGKGLGFTGGTIDKLDSIPGFRTQLSIPEFVELVNKNGIAITGQTAKVSVADKKLYALRDVTGTVDNISLITSSIMSKKLASGSDAILLDVKCGKGAFMESEESAAELGRWMTEIGRLSGKNTKAIVSDMGIPLGRCIGNSLEVIEAIETLKENGPEDLVKLCLTLSGYMIYMGEKAKTPEEGMKLATDSLREGRALKKFADFVESQGGNSEIINDYSLFPKAVYSINIKSDNYGYVQETDAHSVGWASQKSGAGREQTDSQIDYSAGVVLHKKTGEKVSKGDVLATVYGNDLERVDSAAKMISEVFNISDIIPEKTDIIKQVIE